MCFLNVHVNDLLSFQNFVILEFVILQILYYNMTIHQA